MKMISTVALAAAAMAAPAGATVVITSALNGPDTFVPASGYTIDFDTVTPAVSGTGTGGVYNGTSPVFGEYAAPMGDTTNYFATQFGTLSLDTSGIPTNATGFSFYWGSIDSFNTLTVTTNLGSYDFTGDDAVAIGVNPDGGQLDPDTNRRVFFSIGAGESITGLSFMSTQPAFEVDTINFISGAVPEPASWAMMISGFGLVGGAMRRRGMTSAIV